jgi:hypothetical protein
MPLLTTFAGGSVRGFGRLRRVVAGVVDSAAFNISPALEGKSTWTAADGPLNITSGSYTITPINTFSSNVFLWGEGGGFGATHGGGGSGAITARVTFVANQTYYISTFGAGVSANPSAGGGNAAGIFFGPSLTQANSIVIAAGGGGGGDPDNLGGAPGSTAGGVGGHPAGSSGSSARGGGGGTQSAGGGGGNSSPAPALENGTAGSALAGGAGKSGPAANRRGGGGGAGYYGGGGGGYYGYIVGGEQQPGGTGGGGGGGSNFASANTSRVTDVVQYSGSGTTAGNDANSNRGGAGTGGSPSTTRGSAKIYMTLT